MKSLLIVTASGLLAVTAAPVTAQQTPPRPSPTQPAPTPAQTPSQSPMPGQAMTPPTQQARPPAQSMAPQTRPAPAAPAATPRPAAPSAQAAPAHAGSGPRPYQAQSGGDAAGMTYGRWDDGWGARPPAPPAHFTRHDDWYRHVRACQQRYKSYNPRTDMFVPRRGQTARCSL